jgi:alpha-1,3-rhamnosyl/mannosyltransferase
MMRVIINGIAALERKTGIGHYTDSLFRQLRSQQQADRVTLYPAGWTKGIIRFAREWVFGRTKKGATVFSVGDQRQQHRSQLAALSTQSRDLARTAARTACHRHFRAVCARAGFDLYHEPNHLPWGSDLPTVTTIHDLSVLVHPEWHPADRVRAYERHFFRGMSYSRHFLAVSEFTRQEVIRHLGVSPDRVTAVHNGIHPRYHPVPADEVDEALRELGLPRGYLLYVGTIEPRKNILFLMRAYCGLPATLRRAHPLVLVGGWGWKAKEIADYYDTTAQHQGVIHFGYMPDSSLPALYSGARALVYPSHYEGFGLPPVEMLACGGAVIASTAGSLVEVLGGHGCLINPEDEAGWRSALARVLSDDDYVESLRHGVMEFAQRYSWDECARQTWAVYRAVAGR